MSVRASAALVNPSPAAPSAGNSRVPSRSTPVRSRMVASYSALLTPRTGTYPGAPAPDRALGFQHAAILGAYPLALLARGLRLAPRRHLTGLELLDRVLPRLEV